MYKVSVIIPVFNCYDELNRNISTLLRQKFTRNRVEWLLVDDGSTDSSLILCTKLEAKYHNVKVFKQEHKGVSAARNLGIRNAAGKYIFFLDADDEISPKSIKKCVKFFDSVGDECDLITYPIETEYQGDILPSHFRYRYLNKTGVYDLCNNPFIGQTTMNIVVRNKFENNILFDETLAICEDQKYCCDVLSEKLKMGFCAEAKYVYHRSPESSSGKLAGACYMFEPCIKLFEDVFAKFEHVPMAFQGLFVNDIAWKLSSNIFWPYHYDKENFDRATERVKALLKKCYNYTILEHPAIDYFEKFYLLRLKGIDSVDIRLANGAAQIWSEGYLVSNEQSFEMVITKVRVRNPKIFIDGFVKSVFFQFFDKPPRVFVDENSGRLIELEVSESNHNYYLSHEKTQKFWRVKYTCNAERTSKFNFIVQLDGINFLTHFYFMQMTPFDHIQNVNSYSKNDIELYIDNENSWNVKFIEPKTKDRIWLYYDCKGVEKDNGLLQYQHDCLVNDSVKRYYIVSDDRQIKHLPIGAKTVLFGSLEHISVLQEAEKIVTSYIEENNIFPQGVPNVDYSVLANKFTFEIIYLQHGVCHIEMPWKYSADRIQADYVVISTEEENELFTHNGFEDYQLIKAGMPRFDNMKYLRKQNKSKSKKILLALSWRSYLVGNNKNGEWELLKNKFSQSNYFRRINDFLSADSLGLLLKEHGYTLDVKMHPIFAPYQECFENMQDGIFFIGTAELSEYDLLITDFSSLMFDYIFENVPILSFIPDFEEFRCGMNGYRNVDYIAKLGDACVAKSPKEIISSLKAFFDNNESLPYKVSFYDSACEGKSKEKIYDFLYGIKYEIAYL